jgi:hypothetical protein
MTVPECFFSETISSAIGNSDFILETGAELWKQDNTIQLAIGSG